MFSRNSNRRKNTFESFFCKDPQAPIERLVPGSQETANCEGEVWVPRSLKCVLGHGMNCSVCAVTESLSGSAHQQVESVALWTDSQVGKIYLQLQPVKSLLVTKWTPEVVRMHSALSRLKLGYQKFRNMCHNCAQLFLEQTVFKMSPGSPKNFLSKQSTYSFSWWVFFEWLAECLQAHQKCAINSVSGNGVTAV